MSSMKNWMIQIYYPPSYQKYDVKRFIYVKIIKNGHNRKQDGSKSWLLIVFSFYWSNKIFNKEQHGKFMEVSIEGLWTSSQLHKGWNQSTGTTIVKVKPTKNNVNNLTHNKCENGEYQKQALDPLRCKQPSIVKYFDPLPCKGPSCEHGLYQTHLSGTWSIENPTWYMSP